MDQLCKKCNLMKSSSEYYKSIYICKECHKEATSEYKKKNRKKYNEYEKERLKNPINKEKKRQQRKNWSQRNRQRVLEVNRIWKAKNRLRMNELARIREQKRRQIDVNFRLKKCLRARLNDILKHNSKRGSAVRDLGCTIDELKVHLESLFQSGMTWANWSLPGWHIDHIKPLSSFDLTDREQFLKACHYTNLQPLWAIDNIRKSNHV